MTQTQASFQTAAHVFSEWQENVRAGTPPVFYRIGEGELARIEVGPGLVTLIGGAPGAGKTAFVMQAVLDALRLNTDIRALVCNVEMPPEVLMNRQLARLSGIDLTTIRYRQFAAEHTDRLDRGLCTLQQLAGRLAFVNPPFNLQNIAEAADQFHADILVLDYIQRIMPPGDHADKRIAVNATMDYLRQFADAERAVLVLAAVGRTKDAKGRTSYAGDGLGLASFRESSELEYGADDAFILVPHDHQEYDNVTLRHLKSRHTEARNLELHFDRPRQHFSTLAGAPREWRPDGGPERGSYESDLAALWNRTLPADAADDNGGNENDGEDAMNDEQRTEV